MTRDDPRMVCPPSEQVRQIAHVVIALRMVKHVTVQLNTLSHFDLGKLSTHDL